MSITTHTSTIREYVKNHTKDDIAYFFEDQFVKKDAEIERLKAELAAKDKVLEQAIERADLQPADTSDKSYCELNQRLPVWDHRHPDLYAELRKRQEKEKQG